jgi:hypothetical protein
MIPVFRQKIAERAGRPKQGPNGCARRKIQLLHQCYSKLLEGWNLITEKIKRLQWADGTYRRSMIFFSALLGDQPELDAFCCDGSQTCKTCSCPKSMLCDTSRTYSLRSASSARKKVYRLADRGPEDVDSGRYIYMCTYWFILVHISLYMLSSDAYIYIYMAGCLSVTGAGTWSGSLLQGVLRLNMNVFVR